MYVTRYNFCTSIFCMPPNSVLLCFVCPQILNFYVLYAPKFCTSMFRVPPNSVLLCFVCLQILHFYDLYAPNFCTSMFCMPSNSVLLCFLCPQILYFYVLYAPQILYFYFLYAPKFCTSMFCLPRNSVLLCFSMPPQPVQLYPSLTSPYLGSCSGSSPWFLYQMVTQNMLRTCYGTWVLSEEEKNALDLIKGLELIR